MHTVLSKRLNVIIFVLWFTRFNTDPTSRVLRANKGGGPHFLERYELPQETPCEIVRGEGGDQYHRCNALILPPLGLQVNFPQDTTHTPEYYNPMFDVPEDHGTVGLSIFGCDRRTNSGLEP